tara:strand:- start:479 stop:700 length:222 start_codon:yes stop_codon:yes gene_type:complete
MKPGDLVEIYVPSHLPGALTAIKFFANLKKQAGDMCGIVVADHGNSISVLFGENVIVVSKKHARISGQSCKRG